MFKTMKERRNFIDNYKNWGRFLVLPELKLVIYKAKLSTGAEIYATEYGYKDYEDKLCRNVIYSLVLTEGDSFPSSKYYSYFNPTGCGITTLMNYLKAHPEAEALEPPEFFNVIESRGLEIGRIVNIDGEVTDAKIAFSKAAVLKELCDGIRYASERFYDDFFIINREEGTVGAKVILSTIASEQYDVVRCGECMFCNGVSCEHEFGLNGAVQSDDFCPYGKRKDEKI